MTKKYVNVQFANSPFSSYQFVTDIEDLKEFDLVVVDTKNGYQVAKVECYTELVNTSVKEFKWIIQKVDLTAHTERLQRERQMNTLLRKMEARQKELEKVSIFKLLADSDPNMAAMFEEFQALNK
jgi:hypothetical protein